MQDAIEIRAAEDKDLALLQRDVKAAVGRSFERELEEQAQGVHTIYVAISDSAIVGWGFIRWLGPRDPEAMRLFPQAPEIFRLEVVEPRRSQGIGRRLIGAMEEAARARSFEQTSLGVGHENSRAHELYQALHYEDTAITEYWDEYQYPLPDGGIGVARDLCRYLVKQL